MTLRTTPSALRRILPIALTAVVLIAPNAWARPQYAAELKKVLESRDDEEAARIAGRLQCRLCHTTDPPERKHNAFGREVARSLEGKTDVEDPRAIRMALHRAVFLLRNRKPSVAEPATTVRKRYVGTVLKEDSELAAYEMPLSDVLAVLADNHEIEISQDGKAFREAGISPDVPISLVVSDVSLQSLLQFLLSEQHLTYAIQGNGLVVRPIAPEKAIVRPAGTMPRDQEPSALELAKMMKKYKGAKIQVVEKDGTRLSEILLELHETKTGELKSFSVFSSRSSNHKRYVKLSNVKEIRSFNEMLYRVPEETDPVVLESRRLEQEVLQRERARRRAGRESAFRRRAGFESPAESLRDENGRFPLNRQYEEELGEGAEVVEAIGELAAESQAVEQAAEEPAADNQSEPAPPASDPPPADRPAEMDRKTVVLRYRTANGSPPAVSYGARIRYDSRQADDPKVQQATLDDSGQCELSVPADVESIRLYTTPFGGFEGTHPLNAADTTTITIAIEGG